MLLPSGALTLAKESGYRAVRITNLKIPEGSPSHQSARLVATKMTEAGLRAEVANLVIGPGLDGPRDRSSSLLAAVMVDESADRQVKEAVDMQPTSKTVNFLLEDFGGFSFQQGGGTYATLEFLPFDGELYKEAAYLRGVSLLSAPHTSARLEYINTNVLVPSVQAALSKLIANQARLIEQFQRDAEEASLSADKRKAAIDKVSYLTQQAEEMKGLAVCVLEYFTCIRTDLYIWDVADTLEAHSGIVPTYPDPASRSRRARIAHPACIPTRPVCPSCGHRSAG